MSLWYFTEHSLGPGALLEGGGCGSARAWVYQSKGMGMKGWEKAFQGCRRGSGSADDTLLFFTVFLA